MARSFIALSWHALVLLLSITPAAAAAGQTSAAAGTGALEGTVTERQTRRLVASATVLVEITGSRDLRSTDSRDSRDSRHSNTTLTAVTDAEGRFRLENVPAGSHTLRVEAHGYIALSQPDVLVSPGRSSAIVIEIDRGRSGLSEEVVVTASVVDRPPEVTTSSYGMQYAEVRRSAGSIGDINRFVQALPGVVIANDERNDLVTRGGSPNENLTMVDNVEAPNLNHFGAQGTAGGAISMLNTELLADATFLTGGFPAEFGNRLSSVLDIRLREGNRTNTEAEADVNFAGASLVMEGPLASKGSWIASVRRSYLELLTNVLDFPGVPETTSYQFKGVYDIDVNNRLWLVGIGGRDSILLEVDEADLDDPSLLRVDNSGWRIVTGFNWQQLFGKRGYGILGVSDASAHFSVEARDRQLDDRITLLNESGEGETTIKYDVSWQLGRAWTVKGGGAWKRIRSELGIDQPLGVQNPYSVDPARVNAVSVHTSFDTDIGVAHAQVSGPIAPHLKLTLGGRVDRFAYLDAITVSPRAGLSVEISPTVTANASFGRYYQQPDLVYLNADLNRTGFLGGLIPREDGAHGTTEQVLPGAA
jgi:Carboxypeptidase regulatory-like domain/TonB dependent receptor/TonB-dependent Receptor Plug Domain